MHLAPKSNRSWEGLVQAGGGGQGCGRGTGREVWGGPAEHGGEG